MAQMSRRLLPSKDENKVTTFYSSTETLVNKPPKKYNLVPGVEIISYLPLQMSLYFNVYYSVLWIIALIVGLELKFTSLVLHYKYITVITYVVMFVVEIGRLYLGYEGNLREKVAELAGFWLLSLLQFPLVVYSMVNINTIILPLEWVINAPMVLFLLTQILTGFRALQLMVRAQATKYHISQLHHRLKQSDPTNMETKIASEEETGL